MDMDSYDAGMVIITSTIRAEDFKWKNKTMFQMNKQIFSKFAISKKVTDPSYPEDGMYARVMAMEST